MSGARRVLDFSTAEALPSAEDVLRTWDLPERSGLAERARRALDQALALLAELSRPRALVEPLSQAEFAGIYAACAPEHDDTPVARVAGRAEALALFVATLGEDVTQRTRELFAGRDLALGYLLDAAASVAADRLASLAAADFACALPSAEADLRVLPYSPGYCGWPTTGQRALFARLRPAEIGVALSPSCLMSPLKSVSGVLAAGPASAHAFDDDFPFCQACARHECRNRLAAVGDFAWNS